MLPKARDEELVIHEMREETLVYDTKRKKAHCLNQTAALVWRHCDGKTSIAKLAARVHKELDIPADEEVVWLALDRLERAHLLEQPLERRENFKGLSRRDLMKRMGIAAAIVPVVMTVIAPTAAMAATVADSTCEALSPPCMGVTACTGVLLCTPNGSGGCKCVTQ